MKLDDFLSIDAAIGIVYRSNTPNGLQFVRSLGQVGVPVLALSDRGRGMGMCSKYSVPMFCPDGIKEQDSFVHFLQEIGSKLERKATLFLMNDPHVVVVSRYRDILDDYYKIPLPSWEVIDLCLNKIEMYRVASQSGIPIPVTCAPVSEQEVREVALRIPYPCILKPISRYEFRDGKLRQKAFQDVYQVKALQARDSDELLEKFRDAKNRGFRVVIQEKIPGPENSLYTVGLYADRQSDLKSVFVGRKLHQLPPDFGLCTYGESLTNPGIVTLTRNFVKALGFHGIAQVEFKRDARDGQFKLMEINPRGWQWSYLSTACGVNLPYLAYCDLNGLIFPSAFQTTQRKTWTNMQDEVQRFWQFGRKGVLCEQVSWWSWLRWIYSIILRGDNCDAVLSWKDPLPGVFMLLSLLRKSLKDVWHGLKIYFYRKTMEEV